MIKVKSYRFRVIGGGLALALLLTGCTSTGEQGSTGTEESSTAAGQTPTGADPTSSSSVPSPTGTVATGADPAPSGQDACESDATWKTVELASAQILGTSAAWNDQDATLLTRPVGTEIESDPFCEVEITVTHGAEGEFGPDDVRIWVWLPEEWNGRLQAVGGGGTYATNGPVPMNAALAGGYAVVSSDAGIDDSRQPNVFLTDDEELDWQIYENWSFRSVGESAIAAKAAVEAFYGEPASYSYWNGCSNGGRQGVAAAQRYPDVFDGVLAAAPALYGADRLNMTMGWPALVQNDALGGFLEDCKMETFTETILAHCDGADGAVDGLISMPETCDVAEALAPLVGEELPCGVVTQQDIDIILSIFQGPVTADGLPVWFGYAPGVNLAGGVMRVPPSFALQNFAFTDLDHDWTTVSAEDFVTTVRALMQGRLELLATADPSLTEFRDAGGKMLIWHGQADAIFPAAQSVHYVNEVSLLTGEQTPDFLRLFLAPGVDHCAGGPGPAPVDPLGALVAWVEDGQAPETLAAEHRDPDTGEVTMARDLCRYPAVQTYRSGDVDDPDSFTCEEPAS